MRDMGLRRTFEFVFGRFLWVRRVNRAVRCMRNDNAIIPDENDFVVFPDRDGEFSLKSDGIYLGLELAEGTAKQLMDLIDSADVVSRGTIAPPIHGLDQILEYNADTDEPVCLAKIQSPEIDALCDRIARNSQLLDLVSGYIGGINEVHPRLEWSLVVDADYAWRESQNQTVTYHYDVYGYNFVYAFFYLTPTDRLSGAHELIRKSHLRKPVSTLLSSIQHDHQKLIDFYGEDHIQIVEGPPCTGFLEDTSCFHRARPCETSPRLALQVRYA